MNILFWHVHGSWTTAFVQGRHNYLLPVVDGRGPDGRGRAVTWDWPGSAVEISPEKLATHPLDVVVLQRPRDEELANRWLGGRRLGVDIPVIWLEHNAPQGRIAEMRHPAADRRGLTIVHVTPTNALFWDCGSTPTRVIEHGVIDPGRRYTGELARAGVVVNEPVRRGRVTGTDLLPDLATTAPLDIFGIGVAPLGGPRMATYEDLPQGRLHDELARRRVYLHPFRWTSLGLSLIEAMLLGLPVVALATTEVPGAVPPAAGVVTNDLCRLRRGLAELIADPGRAADCGRAARATALERFGLDRFLADWDNVFVEVVSG
jgi:hypothetical protein